MFDRYNQSDDILFYLRSKHTGAENAVQSAEIEELFGIKGAALRQIINKLRCNGQPVCSDANGYFYAKSKAEINDTVQHLLNRNKKIHDTIQGMVLSHQIFYDGTEGCA